MNVKQNINLLTSLPIKPPSKLTALYLIKLVGVCYLVLVLISSVVWSLAMQKKTALMSLQNDKMAVNRAIKARFVKSFGQNKNTQSYPQGFSSHLLALADVAPEGIWLKNIIFAEQNNIIFLGETLEANLITEFIEALNKDPTINGTFDTFTISRSAVSGKDKSSGKKGKHVAIDPNIINFSLGTVSATSSVAKKP